MLAFGLLTQQLVAPHGALSDSPFGDVLSNLSCSSSLDASLLICGDLISIKPSVLRENDKFVNASGRGFYFSEANFTVPPAVFSGNWCDVKASLESFYCSYTFSLGGNAVYSSSSMMTYNQPVLSGQPIQLLNGSTGWVNFSYSSAPGRWAFSSKFTGDVRVKADYYALVLHKPCSWGCNGWYSCDFARTAYYDYPATLVQSDPLVVEQPALNFSIVLDRDYNSSCRVVLGVSDSLNASNWQLDYAGFKAWSEPSTYFIYLDGHGARQIYWSQKTSSPVGGNETFASLGQGYWAASFLRPGGCSSLPRTGLLSVEGKFGNHSQNVPVTQLRQSEINYSVFPQKPKIGDNVTIVFSVNNFRPISAFLWGVSSVVVPNSSGQANYSFILRDSTALVGASQDFGAGWSSAEVDVPFASYDVVGSVWDLGWLAIGVTPLLYGFNRVVRASNSLPAASFKAGLLLLALYALLAVI